MWNDKSNAQKHSGLYFSKDGTKTWNLISYSFEFKKLFIHPETGQLFAAIEDSWLTEEKGYLGRASSDKIYNISR